MHSSAICSLAVVQALEPYVTDGKAAGRECSSGVTAC